MYANCGSRNARCSVYKVEIISFAFKWLILLRSAIKTRFPRPKTRTKRTPSAQAVYQQDINNNSNITTKEVRSKAAVAYGAVVVSYSIFSSNQVSLIQHEQMNILNILPLFPSPGKYVPFFRGADYHIAL